MKNLDELSDSLTAVTNQLHTFSQSLNNPQGVMYALTKDTDLTSSVKGTVTNLKTTTELLNEDLKALQRNFLFRKYFREKAKGKH